MSYPTIDVGGSARRCGIGYGRQARPRIVRALEAYGQIVRRLAGVSWPAAVAWARRYEECVGDLAPQAMAELAGIAEGAGVGFGDVFALNCRSELMFVASANGAGPAECSSFALVGSQLGGAVLAGQNWDWNPLLTDSVVICRAQPRNEVPYLTVGEAGHLAKVGMNGAGLGVCTNTLVSTYDADGYIGLPYHVILRELLRRETVDEAVSYLRSTPRAMSANYLLADRNGDAAGIETTGGREQRLAALRPEDGILCHSNHFLTDDLVSSDARLATNPHTLTRLAALQNGLREHGRDASIEAVRKVLQDHEGFPNSLCSHAHPIDDPAARRATLASVVMDLSAGTMRVAIGQPCSTESDVLEMRSSVACGRPEDDDRLVSPRH